MYIRIPDLHDTIMCQVLKRPLAVMDAAMKPCFEFSNLLGVCAGLVNVT